VATATDMYENRGPPSDPSRQTQRAECPVLDGKRLGRFAGDMRTERRVGARLSTDTFA